MVLLEGDPHLLWGRSPTPEGPENMRASVRPRRGSALSVSALNADRYESKGSTRLSQVRRISMCRTVTTANNEIGASRPTLVREQEAHVSDLAKSGSGAYG
jgi:hypothetical protein